MPDKTKKEKIRAALEGNFCGRGVGHGLVVFFYLTWNSSMRKTEKKTTQREIKMTGTVTKYLNNTGI